MLRYVRASKLLLLPVLNIHSQVSCPNWDNCVLPRIFFGSFAMFSLSPRTGFFFSHPFLLYLCTCFLHSHICKVAQPSFPCSYHILVTSLMFQQDRFTRFCNFAEQSRPCFFKCFFQCFSHFQMLQKKMLLASFTAPFLLLSLLFPAAFSYRVETAEVVTVLSLNSFTTRTTKSTSSRSVWWLCDPSLSLNNSYFSSFDLFQPPILWKYFNRWSFNRI